MRRFQRMIIHSDSKSAIARMSHTGAGRGQATAIRVQESLLATFARDSREVSIQWVKGHSGVPGNERADQLAGRAAEQGAGPSRSPQAWGPRGAQRRQGGLEQRPSSPRSRRGPRSHPGTGVGGVPLSGW
jgi:hypothetical protein